MAARTPKSPARPAAKILRQRVLSGGERLWKFSDFKDLPPAAVAQALSRLQRRGELQRVGKGVYYRPRPTVFGLSRPNPSLLRKRVVPGAAKIFPVGLSAASYLGLTTQNPARAQVAMSGRTAPRLLQAGGMEVHTRRPASWETLSERDAAVLEILRLRGEVSELPEAETVNRLLGLLREEGRFARLVKVSNSEPPRVRALLGALGEELGAPKKLLDKLRSEINPLSRFDFGALSGVTYGRKWQVKERLRRAAI